jgi:hypothetical protein
LGSKSARYKDSIELSDFAELKTTADSKPMRRKDEEKNSTKSKLWESIMANAEEDKGSSSEDDDQV